MKRSKQSESAASETATDADTTLDALIRIESQVGKVESQVGKVEAQNAALKDLITQFIKHFDRQLGRLSGDTERQGKIEKLRAELAELEG